MAGGADGNPRISRDILFSPQPPAVGGSTAELPPRLVESPVAGELVSTVLSNWVHALAMVLASHHNHFNGANALPRLQCYKRCKPVQRQLPDPHAIFPICRAERMSRRQCLRRICKTKRALWQQSHAACSSRGLQCRVRAVYPEFNTFLGSLVCLIHSIFPEARAGGEAEPRVSLGARATEPSVVAAVLQQLPRRGTGSLIIRGTAVDASPDGAAPSADHQGGAAEGGALGGPAPPLDLASTLPASQHDEGAAEGACGASLTVAEPPTESRTALVSNTEISCAGSAHPCAADSAVEPDPQVPDAAAAEVCAGYPGAAQPCPSEAGAKASFARAGSQSAAAWDDGGAAAGASTAGRPGGSSAKPGQETLSALHTVLDPGPDAGSTPPEAPPPLTDPQRDSGTASGSDDVAAAVTEIAVPEVAHTAAAPGEDTLTTMPIDCDAVLVTAVVAAAGQLDGAGPAADSRTASGPDVMRWADPDSAAAAWQSGTPAASGLPRVSLDLTPAATAPDGRPGQTAGGTETEAHVPADGTQVPAADAHVPAAAHDQLLPPGTAEAPACAIGPYSLALDGDLDEDAATSDASGSRHGDPGIDSDSTMQDVQPTLGATSPAAALVIDVLAAAAPGSAAERDQSAAAPADDRPAVPLVGTPAGDLLVKHTLCLSDGLSPPVCYQTSRLDSFLRNARTSSSLSRPHLQLGQPTSADLAHTAKVFFPPALRSVDDSAHVQLSTNALVPVLFAGQGNLQRRSMVRGCRGPAHLHELMGGLPLQGRRVWARVAESAPPPRSRQEVDRLLAIMHRGPHDQLAPPPHPPAGPTAGGPAPAAGGLSTGTAAAGGPALHPPPRPRRMAVPGAAPPLFVQHRRLCRRRRSRRGRY